MAVEYLESKSVTILLFRLEITNQVVDPAIFLEFDSASEKENIRGVGGGVQRKHARKPVWLSALIESFVTFLHTSGCIESYFKTKLMCLFNALAPLYLYLCSLVSIVNEGLTCQNVCNSVIVGHENCLKYTFSSMTTRHVVASREVAAYDRISWKMRHICTIEQNVKNCMKMRPGPILFAHF